MVYKQTDASSAHAAALRLKGGRWLKKLREDAGLTQRELTVKLGLDYYTFISQLENGKGRVPPDLIIPWATAVGLNPREFAYTLTSFYDPFLYQALMWGDDPAAPGEKKNEVGDGRAVDPVGDHGVDHADSPPGKPRAGTRGRRRSKR